MEKKKILAVDDNAINLSAIEKALQDEYDIVPVISGRRALKYLKMHGVDLILLDVRMPDMDGMETLTEIRKLEKLSEVPVIFLTALNENEIPEGGSHLGVRDCITKPFDEEDLKARIRQFL